MPMTKTFAVIPAFNEGNCIQPVIEQARKYVDKVIVVDDGSTDSTNLITSKSNVICLKHMINLGKGAALKTGCDFAVKNGAGNIITIDADAQHDPNDIPKFVQNLKDNDVVLAYRKLDRNMPLVLKFGNWFINKTIRYLYGIRIKDSQCGYRAFTSDAYRMLRWKSSDYSMESEMIAKIGKHKISFKEIEIKTVYGDSYKGTTILDGIKIVFNLLIWKLNNI
jgi:glycosyltransferase involved in cell wall biosynthesis